VSGEEYARGWGRNIEGCKINTTKGSILCLAFVKHSFGGWGRFSRGPGIAGSNGMSEVRRGLRQDTKLCACLTCRTEVWRRGGRTHRASSRGETEEKLDRAVRLV
jgi:hypothetical protein